jgi:alkanesulfonate monooxygenase SsuD/methylene tetrahydromethanopterin reductase-like flavin-dependent oxidoreductase (luciferase family)
LGAVILPLHDPVKVAEQIGVLDLMSGGRLEVTLGAGYVASEFAMFNASLRDRAKLMDQGIDIILRALHGERFTAGGREIYVRPLPLQKPEDIIYGGGGVEASAKRAAKFGIGFVPINPSTIPIYEAECRRLGHEPKKPLSGGGGPLGILICEDPEEGWRQFQPHALHMVREYAKWAAQEPNSNSPFVGLDNEEALRKSGLFVAWTPDEVVKFASHSGSLSIMPLLAGLKPEIGWKTLELLRDKVMPRLSGGQ